MPSPLLRIVVRAPASVANLGSGYDCLALAVDLWNEYELYSADRGLDGQAEYTFADEFTGRYAAADPRLRAFNENLFVRTFADTRKYLCDKAGLRVPHRPCFVRQCVTIPPIRGLGSSSSASVAGVLAAFQYRAHYYPIRGPEELVKGIRPKVDVQHRLAEVQASLAMTSDGHPDNVCASLAGGLTYSFLPDKEHAWSPDPRRLHFFRDDITDDALRCIALVPKKPLGTKKARDVLNIERYGVEDVVFNLTRSTCLPRVLGDRRYDLLREVTRDRVHQERRARQTFTEGGAWLNLASIFEAALSADAYSCCVSGAGSTLVALANENRADAVARALREAFDDEVARVRSIRRKFGVDEQLPPTDWYAEDVLVLPISNWGASCTSELVKDGLGLEHWLAQLPSESAPVQTGFPVVSPIQAPGRKVFLSHVTENAATVRKLQTQLDDNDINVFRVPEDVDPGEAWRSVLRQAIESGECFVPCFSAQCMRGPKSFMWEEIRIAIDEYRQRSPYHRWLIPVSLDGTAIPPMRISAAETLRDLQWVDLSADWFAGVDVWSARLRPTQPKPVQTRSGWMSLGVPKSKPTTAGRPQRPAPAITHFRMLI